MRATQFSSVHRVVTSFYITDTNIYNLPWMLSKILMKKDESRGRFL